MGQTLGRFLTGAVLCAAVLLLQCQSQESLPSYRGGAGPSSQSTAAPVLTARPLLVRIAEEVATVRAALGDSVLPDPTVFGKKVDTMVMRVSSRLFMENDPRVIFETLRAFVFDELAIGFERDKTSLAGMFPHTVYEARKGSCVGNSLLVLVLAERLDIPMKGVLAPEHLFVRFDNGDLQYNVETIKQGETYDNDWYRERYEIRDSTWYDKLENLGNDELMGVLRYNIGNVFREHGVTDKSADYYRLAVEAIPQFAEAWGNLGIALQAQGRESEALEALEKARELDPSLERLQQNIGALQIRLAKHEKAIEEYQAALERTPDDPELLYGLAFACYGAGKYKEARTLAGRVVELRENHADARALLERARAHL